MSEYKRLTDTIHYSLLTKQELFRRLHRLENKIEDGQLVDISKLKRLSELEKMLENGQLIELPCKVGTTVYCITGYYKGLFKRKFIYDIVEYPFEIGMVNTYQIDWFITKEQAEARLEEFLKNGR